MNIAIRDAIDAVREHGIHLGRQATSVDSGSAPALARAPLISFDDLVFETTRRGMQVEIGRGVFSSVYAATYLGERVAVKSFVLPTGITDTSAIEKLFWREATLQYHLRHDSIMQLHGAVVNRDEEGGPVTMLALVMPRAGASLEGVLSPSASASTPAHTYPASNVLLKWLGEIASAIRFLHARGIFHGDIKPANVLLEADEHQRRVAKVCDFGHSRMRRDGEDAASSIGAPGGTPRYRDPAVINGNNAMRKASDVYSFGILAWQVLCGTVPFEGMDVATVSAHTVAGGRPPIDALESKLSAGVCAVVAPLLERCWATDQAERPTMEGICDILSHLEV